MADDKPTNEAPTFTKEPNAIRRRGGWKKGKPRGKPAWNSKKAAAERSGLNERPDGRRWQDDPKYEKFTRNAPKSWTDFSNENPLSIDASTIDGIRRQGFELEWLAESVMGNGDIVAGQLSQKRRNGFTRLEPGDFGIDTIEHGGLALYARPRGLQQAAEKAELDKAQDQIRRKQEAHMMGDLPGVSLASRHPSARGYNHHRRSIERLDVPSDKD